MKERSGIIRYDAQDHVGNGIQFLTLGFLKGLAQQETKGVLELVLLVLKQVGGVCAC